MLRKNENGFGLVETIVALGVALIVITALVSLSIFTLRSSVRGKLLLMSSRLANSELELVRAYRDRTSFTWDNFLTDTVGCTSVNVCSMSLSPSLGVSSGSKDTQVGSDKITTEFWLTNPTSGGNASLTDTIVRINVHTSYVIGSDTKDNYIYSDVTNWRN